jgi:hypothetical protein
MGKPHGKTCIRLDRFGLGDTLPIPGAHEGTVAFADMQSRSALLQALDEFDRLGRAGFLAKYRFGPARRYFLAHEGQLYDSKAIVGAAHAREFPDASAVARQP